MAFLSRVGLPSLAVILGLSAASLVSAATLSGTVKDASGASTPRAHLELSGAALPAPLAFDADANGHFTSPDLKLGSYTLKITAPGFEPVTQSVVVTDSVAPLTIALQVATLHQEVTVEGKVSLHANNDPIYRQLRDSGLGKSFEISNFDMKLDVASFHLTQGTITFLQPVDGVVTGAIFVGTGHFTLKPSQPIDAAELERRAKQPQLEEDLSSIVFRYAPSFNHNLTSSIKTPVDTPAAVSSIYSQWREKVRHRREIPTSLTESVFNGEEMDNIDADTLAAIYNPVPQHFFFQAYIHGEKYKDLRFYVRARGGAISGMDSPEEIGLVNYAPDSLDDGIWYLSHAQNEYAANLASSQQERRFVVARKFKIETVLGKNDHLTSVATVTFEPLIAGERVVRFQLLPSLRVSRVSNSDGAELSFIQESRKSDGSFYVILPTAGELKKEISLTIEYAGDKVVTKAGEGSFYITAREAWYPNLNGFKDRAMYDLTFRIPKPYHLVSVGELQSETIEDGQSVSHWVTKVPVYVAGFNFGDYKKQTLHDDQTGYDITGYYVPNFRIFWLTTMRLKALPQAP